METDRHYFLEGLFIIGLAIAAALAFVWLAKTGHRDDVLYRIHFAESVSGLSLGDPVKFHGVDVGTVKAMAIDARGSAAGSGGRERCARTRRSRPKPGRACG